MCPYLCAEEEEEEEEEEEVKEEEEEVVVVKKQVVEEEVDFAPTAAADLDMDEVSGHLEVQCSTQSQFLLVSFCVLVHAIAAQVYMFLNQSE